MKEFNTFIFLICIPFIGNSQTITASAGWSVIVPATIVVEAGLNYTTTTTTTSASSQTLINIAGFPPSSNFTISVHKSDIVWDASLILSIARNASGTGSTGGTIAGSTGFIVLTSTPQVLCTGNVGSGTGWTGIGTRYRYIGRTVLIPAKTYSTTIVYTVSN